MKMLLNGVYSYEEIEKFAEENNYNFDEFGKFIIGENFISLKKDVKTKSFILVSATSSKSYYELIYSD